jgi:hypothetical protein
MKTETWTPSTREEVLAALYLIAACQAWQADIRWLAFLLFAKALCDTLCAMKLAWREFVSEMPAARGAAGTGPVKEA